MPLEVGGALRLRLEAAGRGQINAGGIAGRGQQAGGQGQQAEAIKEPEFRFTSFRFQILCFSSLTPDAVAQQA